MATSLKPMVIALAAVFVVGCGSQPKPLYNWGPYQAVMYSHFGGEAPESQIQVLEAHLAELQSQSQTPPPGLYAHLGLLYGKLGAEAEQREMFEREKDLYPESAVFIDNLNNKFKVKP